MGETAAGLGRSLAGGGVQGGSMCSNALECAPRGHNSGHIWDRAALKRVCRKPLKRNGGQGEN